MNERGCNCGEHDVCDVCAGRRYPSIAAPPATAPSDNVQVRPGNVGQYDTTSPFEPIKIIEWYNLNFSLGNVVKYVLRAGRKPGVLDIEDLEKARTYIDFEIERRRRGAGGAS